MTQDRIVIAPQGRAGAVAAGVRGCCLALLLFAVVVGAAQAAPLPDVDLEAYRLAREALLAAERLESGLQPDPATRNALEALVRDATRTRERVDALGVQSPHGVRRQLERATERLEQALAAVPPVRADAQIKLPFGTITGTVFDAGSTPLSSINVQARNPTTGFVVAQAASAADGSYTLSTGPGTYLVRTANGGTAVPGYVNVVYEGIPCPSTVVATQYCKDYVGNPVVVASGGNVAGIDFHLPRAGGIAGTVTRESDGTPVGGIATHVWAEDGSFIATVLTSTAAGTVGTYQFPSVPPGRYRVIANADSANDGLGDLVQSLPDRVCEYDNSVGDCNYFPDIDFVTVASGVITAGVDFALPARVRVSGTVRDELGNPIPDAFVSLLAADGTAFPFSVSDAGGVFAFEHVRPTDYVVVAEARGYLDRLLPSNVSVARCIASRAQCAPLAVGGVLTIASSVSGIDIVLERGASISGRITSAADGTPVQLAVVAKSPGGDGVAFATTNGDYTITGLPDGVYHVYVPNFGSLTDTAYGDVACRDACSDAGIPVTATKTAPASGIDIAVAAAGTVSGQITDAVTGLPLRIGRGRIELFAIPPPGMPQPDSYTYLATMQTTSGYTLSGVAPGAYRAVFATTSVAGWMDAGSNGLPCPRGGCDQSLLPAIYVTAGSNTTGLDVTLQRGTSIKGRLTDATTGGPIVPFAYDHASGTSVPQSIFFYTPTGTYAGFGSIDAAGNYRSSTGFPPGTYFSSSFGLRDPEVPGFSGGYIDQNYLGIPCAYARCGRSSGTGIPVAGSEVANVDFAFERGGSIGGTIRRAGDLAGLSGVTVDAFDAQGRRVGLVRTNVNGGYRVYSLPTGTYYLSTRNELGYLDEGFGNLPCEPFCNALDGTAVAVTQPDATLGIDFELSRSAMIGGTVTDGAAAPNVTVELYGAIGNLLTSVTSAANGSYAFRDLAGGRYFVRTRNAIGRVDALFDGATCVGTACDVRSGTPIDVAAGNSAVVNLALGSPAAIAGTVTNSFGTNMSGVALQLLDARGAVAGITTTAPNGAYRFASLPAGTYRVVTRNTPGFADEAFDNVPCPATCNGLIGTPISVAASATTTVDIQLSLGAVVSGQVRAAGSGIPLPGTTVQAYLPYNGTLILAGQTATNLAGNYQIRSLPNGSYRLRAQTNLGFVGEVYDNKPCSGYCDFNSGTPVDIVGGVSVSGRNFDLEFGRSISGQVLSGVTGGVLAGVAVQAYLNGNPAGTGTTDSDGFYSVMGLVPGAYKLQTLSTTGFINQVYGSPVSLPCSPNPCSIGSGTSISVTGGDATSINFNLGRGTTVSGTATDVFSNPLTDGTATLHSSAGALVLSTIISRGRWEFTGVADGTYYVLIENSVGLIDQVYANVPCPAGACDVTQGTPIVVGATARAKGAASNNAIDVVLGAGRTISGRVQDATTSAPLANSTVYFFDAAGALVGDALTDGAGNYTSTGGFANGTYYAATANGTTRGVAANYVNGLFSGGTCLLGCTVTNGTPITIGGAPIVNVNFNLATGIGFGGTVVDGSANPVQQVTIRVVDSAGRAAGTFTTNSLGVFIADGLTTGTYYARTINEQGLQDVLFGNAPCVGNCSVLASSPIAISAGNQPQNIDFTLSPPVTIFGDGFE